MNDWQGTTATPAFRTEIVAYRIKFLQRAALLVCKKTKQGEETSHVECHGGTVPSNHPVPSPSHLPLLFHRLPIFLLDRLSSPRPVCPDPVAFIVPYPSLPLRVHTVPPTRLLDLSNFLSLYFFPGRKIASFLDLYPLRHPRISFLLVLLLT